MKEMFAKFLKNERGNATFEFVIWVPGFIFLLMFFLDLSMYFETRTDMLKATREAARSVAVGSLQVDQVPAFLSQEIGRTVSFGTAVSGTGSVTIDTSVPVSAATLFGLIRLMTDSIDLHVILRREISADQFETGILQPLGSANG